MIEKKILENVWKVNWKVKEEFTKNGKLSIREEEHDNGAKEII